MQIIRHEQENIHPIFDEFDKLYTLLSEKADTHHNKLVRPTLDNSFAQLLQIFQDNGISVDVQLENKHFQKYRRPRNSSKNIIVCFSGGKDSIATVYKYLKDGYKVYLYHMKHINPPLFDEYKVAQEFADYVQVPIYFDSIKLSGYHDYVEHPMKNMIIANGALQYGLREKIGTNIVFGNYTTSTLEIDNFEFCGGDCIEMWKIYDKIISSGLLSNFHMNIGLETMTEALDLVCADQELLTRSVSCLGRASFRDYWKKWVEQKFKVKLPPHRCGRCYKCCIEYIYMADRGLQKYNEQYYKYCFNNLKKSVEHQDGMEYSNWEVWNQFFTGEPRKELA